MAYLSIIFFALNLTVLIAGYVFVRYRLDRRYINKEVMTEVRNEINQLIISLNEATMENVTLAENKIQLVKKTIDLAEMKLLQFEDTIRTHEKRKIKDSDTGNYPEVSNTTVKKVQENTIPRETYDPLHIMTQSRANVVKAETLRLEAEEKVNLENNQLTDMTVTEKIIYLNAKGVKAEDIRSRLSLDPGEFEFLLNMENIVLK